jgi:hypothetical protein
MYLLFYCYFFDGIFLEVSSFLPSAFHLVVLVKARSNSNVQWGVINYFASVSFSQAL